MGECLFLSKRWSKRLEQAESEMEEVSRVFLIACTIITYCHLEVIGVMKGD